MWFLTTFATVRTIYKDIKVTRKWPTKSSTQRCDWLRARSRLGHSRVPGQLSDLNFESLLVKRPNLSIFLQYRISYDIVTRNCGLHYRWIMSIWMQCYFRSWWSPKILQSPYTYYSISVPMHPPVLELSFWTEFSVLNSQNLEKKAKIWAHDTSTAELIWQLTSYVQT